MSALLESGISVEVTRCLLVTVLEAEYTRDSLSFSGQIPSYSSAANFTRNVNRYRHVSLIFGTAHTQMSTLYKILKINKLICTKLTQTKKLNLKFQRSLDI